MANKKTEEGFKPISIPKVPVGTIERIKDTNIAITKFVRLAIEEKLERDSKK